MKSVIKFAIALLLVVFPAGVSAFSFAIAPFFVPVKAVGSAIRSGPDGVSSAIKSARLTMRLKAGEPADSKEEDLELTLAVIMQHISSSDDMITDDDEDDDGENNEKGDENVSTLKKVKSIGSKMKQKVKKKLKSKLSSGD
mmetsp:Transcript_45129/g.94657  ORF Transcript_45129/g.94657 Transcript_45129/m.94657 type:complete len:141 (+) Transcript_45129:267-689(+)|eukprot:CAMPEP_0183733504 /NCGR_PEP_ID=MMETSP0737-20130205/41408_1 /TAXON_ID=385413 /ORGANISM="Thalassiosira miniscula, Strain CCMP1093" /LENGTH=140 /DNA_ID=CAMNT_0025966773 /DNA_START=174 /DNA_END=596 /DNA_ORIENTATION=-